MARIILYEHANFGGRQFPLTQSEPELRRYGWDHAVSSIFVESGLWQPFLLHNFGGTPYGPLPPGSYPHPDSGDQYTFPNDAIGSVLLVRPLEPNKDGPKDADLLRLNTAQAIAEWIAMNRVAIAAGGAGDIDVLLDKIAKR